ncbi:FHA domain-containing protein [Lignipirellula cremea]|uniref:FHA domain protein n=1 Tax=Lignipirellula cremea TaxID=2528010 RepID=A0A518DS81_9BACT|nr:FHA domain-containing protein [Lignipirellula cremea]QDU94694.1 FHA domain protein [Lignipirellula cremea]
MTKYGELVPLGGGDPIPLLTDNLKVGRRESCDIVLRFSNISAHHCQLSVEEGYWFVCDLSSRNGVKVNGVKIAPELRKRLDPGDKLSVAKHNYEIQYVPGDLGAVGVPPSDEQPSGLTNQSLMQRAGLDRRRTQEIDIKSRLDVKNNAAGQLKRRPPQ